MPNPVQCTTYSVRCVFANGDAIVGTVQIEHEGRFAVDGRALHLQLLTDYQQEQLDSALFEGHETSGHIDADDGTDAFSWTLRDSHTFDATP